MLVYLNLVCYFSNNNNINSNNNNNNTLQAQYQDIGFNLMSFGKFVENKRYNVNRLIYIGKVVELVKHEGNYINIKIKKYIIIIMLFK
jgi:hypothetical protein